MKIGDPDLARQLRRRLKLPVIAGPMFLVSGPDLVIASSRAGVTPLATALLLS
jgi:nitronate monooxygenase